ncbi:DUF2341 domain-containing protein [Stieleria marina]|uniref:Cadherin domain protein n=1 Tax=Stieleria marina TaxID=1930275 RepID=A0A517NY14_9BACT|nr:Cadherin domain protein [Planctomycetes bacterium K23_9]
MRNGLEDYWQRLRLVVDKGWSCVNGPEFSGRETVREVRGTQMSQLEPRILFSATPIDPSLLMGDSQNPVMVEQAEIETQESSSSSTTTTDQTQTTRDLVVIDSKVPDLQQLLDDLSHSRPDSAVFVLGPDVDGVDQISAILESHQDIDSLHIVSHAENGAVRLGNTWLGESNLPGYAGQIAAWQNSLTSDADVLFYGCDLASDSSGQGFIDSISVLTGADVAASTDDTGHAKYEANWELEYSTGSIDTATVFSSQFTEEWLGKLATISVTTFDDEDNGTGLVSLREAIGMASAGDTIDLHSIGAGTFALQLDTLDISDDLTIEGLGAGSTIINGNGLGKRIFHLQNTSVVNISMLTIQAGHENNGGGIFVDNDSTLNLTDARLTGNTSDKGGAIHVHGAANLNRVLFDANHASADGGAIHFHDSNGGSLTNVTFSGNSAISDGGAIWTDSAITIVNSTLTLNHAAEAGGIFNDSGTVNLSNTLIAGNTATSANNDVLGDFASDGFNLIETVGEATGFGSDLTGVSANLGLLTDNGGQFYTHALLTGSAAINAGTTGGPATDARGISRNAAPDIGAFELQATLTSVPEFRVNQTTANTQETSAANRGSQQAVAIAADGSYTIVWSSLNQDSDGWGVYARRFDSAGNALTGEIQVAQSTVNHQKWARVDSADDGSFVVTWTQTNAVNVPLDVYARRFGANGVALDDEFVVNTTTASEQANSSIAVDSAGDFIIVWAGNGTGDNGGVFYRRFDRDGIAVDAVEVLVNRDDLDDEAEPSVAMNEAGQFVVAWESLGEIYIRHFDATGSPTHDDVRVDNNLAAASNPDVEIDSTGRSVVVYRTNGAFGGVGAGVWGKAYNHDGTERHTFFEVSDQSFSSDNTSPSIAMDSDGKFVVVYHGDDDGDGSGSSVKVRSYDADAGALTDAVQVNATSGSDQQMASVAMIDMENFVVVWSGDGNQAGQVDPSGVFARQFHFESPVIDLDANDSSGVGGGDFAVSFTDGGAPVLIADSDATISDSDSTHLESLVVTITDRQDGGDEQLASDTTGTNITASYSAGELTLTGNDTIANYQQVLRSITYDNDAFPATGTTRTITFVANDGYVDSNLGTTTLTIAAAVNQAPTAVAGGPYSIGEGDDLDLDASGSSDSDGTIASYEWDLDNDGNFGEPGEAVGVAPNVSWTTLQSFGIDDDGVHVIGLRVTDDNGQTTDTTVSLTVVDVAPDIVVTGSGAATVGSAYTLNLSATDAGDDSISGWIVNWGDGTTTTYGAVSSAEHIYSGGAGQTVNVLVSAINEEGTFHQTQSFVTSSAGNPNDAVYRIDPTTGNYEVASGSVFGGVQLNDPGEAVVGPDGMLYVGSFGTNTIEKFDPVDGTALGTFVSDTDLDQVGGLAFGPDGNLYVASYANGEIHRYDGSTGARVDAAGSAFISGLSGPIDLLFHSDGFLYVSNHGSGTIQRFDASTGTVDPAGNFVESGLLNGPEFMAFGPNGYLYVASYNNDSVYRFDSAGANVDGAGAYISGGGLDGPVGLSFGPDGLMYVGSENSDVIRRYDVSGGTAVFVDDYVSNAAITENRFLTFQPGHQVALSAPANSTPVSVDDLYTVDEDTTLDSNDTWFDGDWSYRRTLSFDNQGQSENLAGFPVLVSLEASNIDYTKTKDGGEDLRFVDGDGNLLAHDIELWNESGTSYVWVNVPQIDQGSSTDFVWMYYGNAAAVDSQDASGVWSAGYDAVYHLHDDELDSTDNSNDGSNSGSTNTTGQFGDAQRFDGVSDVVTLGSNASLDNTFDGGGTISVWINPTDWGENGLGRILDKSSGTTPSPGGWSLQVEDGDESLIFEHGFGSSAGRWRVEDFSITLNQWQQVTVVYDSSNPTVAPTIYVNGVAKNLTQSSVPSGAMVSDAGIDLAIGNYAAGTNRTFNGSIDEVRISTGSRSADWVAAQYLASAGGFTTVGFEQSKAGVLGNDVDLDGNTLTATLVSGPSNSQAFNLASDGSFTYTATNNFSGEDTFVYRANDGASDSALTTVTITVNATNDAPTDITLSNASLSENADGATIGTVGAVDPDSGDTHTWSVSDSRFEVVGTTLKLKAGETLDRESEATVSLTITATDQAGTGIAYDEAFTITVDNVNETPTDITLTNSSVDENDDGATIGTVGVVEPDAGDTHAWSVSDSRFEIVGTTLKLKTGETLDKESEATVSLTITATDQGGTGIAYDEVFTITVDNINESPTDITLSSSSVDENDDGATIGTVGAVDPDSGDTHIWSVSDTRFEIVGTTLKLKAGETLDRESEATVSLTITATDQGGTGIAYDEAFTITVDNVNESPTDITLSNSSVSEHDDGAAIGTLEASDPDAADTHAWTVDDIRFEIVGGTLRLKSGETLDAGTEPTVSLNVTATDQAGAGIAFSKVFTVTVDEINDAPTVAVSNVTATIGEGASTTSSTKVADISVTDDSEGTNDLSLSGADAAMFEIKASGTELHLRQGVTLDFEGNPSLDVTVNVDDSAVGANPDDSQSISITVTDENDAPTDIDLSNQAVTENDAGAAIGTLTAMDQDAGDTHVWQVDDSRFEVVGNQLQLKAGQFLDADSEPTVDLLVTVTDQLGLGEQYTETFTITVGNVNESPVSVSDSYRIRAGETLNGTSVLANDIDPESDAMTAVELVSTSNGTLVLAADGTFTYTPADGFVGTDVFVYEATDGSLASDLTTVTIEVTFVAPLPTSVDTDADTESERTDKDNDDDSDEEDGDQELGLKSNSGEFVGDGGNDDEETRDRRPAPLPIETLGADETGFGQQHSADGSILDAVSQQFDSFHAESQRSEGSGDVTNDVMKSSLGRTIASVINADHALMIAPGLMWNELDEQMEFVESQIQGDLIIVGAAGAAASSFTVGLVTLALRTGFLASGLLAQMPAWKSLDPLLVMQGLGGTGDEESLEEVMQNRIETLDNEEQNAQNA